MLNRVSGWPSPRTRRRRSSVRVSFTALVIQAPLEKQLSDLVVGHGNLLIACVKIASYNQHLINIARLLSSEPWSLALPSLLGRGSRRRHLISRAPANTSSPFLVLD